MSSKTHLGWRAENADDLLCTPLFKFAYQEKMHVLHGEKGSKLLKFVNDLFLKQEGFFGKEQTTSVNAIQKQ